MMSFGDVTHVFFLASLHLLQATALIAMAVGGATIVVGGRKSGAKRVPRNAALVWLFVATSLFAQNATTSLRGVVKDPSGALVPGATVTLSNDATGQVLQTKSDNSGTYQFNQIQPAKYSITVSAAGFSDQKKFAELLVNQPATIDFGLTLQASADVVNVSSAAQTLNTTDASLGDSMDSTQIEALPSESRNVPDLLSLQPGVLYLQQQGDSDSRSGSVNGGRSDQGNITLDGIDDNDQLNGYAFTGVLRSTQDSIEEFRVTTGNANADAGRSSGAQVSMVTKSGTNSFHGSAYEYNRPTFTVANDWFNKQAELNEGLPNVPGKLIRNIFGGTLGGPVVKKKLFFFGAYEGLRRAENAQVSETVPTASYRQGNLLYLGDNPNGSTSVNTLSSTQVAQLDSACVANGVCPWGPGPDPNALQYFQQYPLPNGTTLGDGYNTASYSFSSPNPVTQNTSIAKIDYIPSEKHHLFWRGNLQKDTTAAVEQFPGQGPSSVYEDNTKGFTVGDTWIVTPSIVNDIRYGYIRQANSNRGVGAGDYVDFSGITSLTSESRTTISSVPVNNIIDNLSWQKGAHTFQVGANWRLIHQNSSTDANSHISAYSEPYWLSGNPPDPQSVGAPPVDGGFSNSYLYAYANLVGTIPLLNTAYNYQITSPTSGTLLPDGAFINRNFITNEYEYYLQDAWKVRPNLTLTVGLRHSILQTPYESNGQQVSPTIDTHAWFLEREAAAQKGQVYEPDLSFVPSGPAYGRPGYWPKSKDNIAPRLALDYSPDSKTSIRAGFGIYYDHYGQALVNTFDQFGSFGVGGVLSSPPDNFSYETAPRFTGRHNLPSINSGTVPSTASFPYTPPEGLFDITWGIDTRLKTPYSEAMDLSVQRQLAGGFTLEAAYVGRLGRHLLQSLDLAMPTDFVDTSGGGDYFAAGTQLSRDVDANAGNANASVAPIQYFEDVFPFMKGYDYPGESATQAIYTHEWAPYRSDLGATTALADLDFYCVYGCPLGTRFWQKQFSSLYALSTIGMSYYNAGQLIVRHPSNHGLQLDFSYTLSKSIDMGSDTERATEDTNKGAFSQIANSWKPYLDRAVSDFDTRHLITADWVYQLPIGQGKLLLNKANHFENAFLGGWQWSGIERWSSGLPFSLHEPGWTTGYNAQSFAVVTGTVKMHRHFDQNGNPQFFADPAAIESGVQTGSPIRLPYPGEAGERNNFRGDGIFNIDSGLSKSWKLGEYGGLKFSWEVYNVTNTVRFDPASIGSYLTEGNLGIANSELSLGRRMQFALRYDF